MVAKEEEADGTLKNGRGVFSNAWSKVSRVGELVGSVGELGNRLGSAATRLAEEAEREQALLEAAALASKEAEALSTQAGQTIQPQQTLQEFLQPPAQPAPQRSPPPLPSEPSQSSSSTQDLWQQAEELRRRLDSERSLRRSRGEELRKKDAVVRTLQVELESARREGATASAALGEAEATAGKSMQQLEELRIEYRSMSAIYEAQSAVLQQHAAMADGREWARDGPETDALVDTKLALAEASQALDQARLDWQLRVEQTCELINALGTQNSEIRSRLHAAEESSFGSSLQRLFRVATGRRDPMDNSGNSESTK